MKNDENEQFALNKSKSNVKNRKLLFSAQIYFFKIVYLL